MESNAVASWYKNLQEPSLVVVFCLEYCIFYCRFKDKECLSSVRFTLQYKHITTVVDWVCIVNRCRETNSNVRQNIAFTPDWVTKSSQVYITPFWSLFIFVQIRLDRSGRFQNHCEIAQNRAAAMKWTEFRIW